MDFKGEAELPAEGTEVTEQGRQELVDAGEDAGQTWLIRTGRWWAVSLTRMAATKALDMSSLLEGGG